jgi:hypothetical protein
MGVEELDAAVLLLEEEDVEAEEGIEIGRSLACI